MMSKLVIGIGLGYVAEKIQLSPSEPADTLQQLKLLQQSRPKDDG